jgi:hypothetical protein
VRRPNWIAWIGATVVAYSLGVGVGTWLAGATARPLSAALGGILFVLVYGAVVGLGVSLVQLLAIPRRAVPWRAWLAATAAGGALGLAVASVIGETLANLIDPGVNLILSEGVIQCTSGAAVGLWIGFAQWLVLRPAIPSGRIWILMTALGGAVGYGIAAVVLEVVDVQVLRAAIVPSFGAILGGFIGIAQALVLRSRV